MLSRHVHCQFKYITEHVRAFSFHAGELRAVISLPNKGEQTPVKQALKKGMGFFVFCSWKTHVRCLTLLEH